MKPYYEEAGITIYCGMCEEVLPDLGSSSFDACITDPPYGLSKNESRSPQRKSGVEQNKAGFMGMKWDACAPGPEIWAAILRTLKPGAHALAFGGTRTHHRLMCAMEDSGFEIRDVCMWLYGSGFPKNLDLSKALDKQAGAVRDVAGTRSSDGGRNYESWRAKEGRTDLPPNLHKVLNIPVTIPATEAAKQFNGYGTALKPAWEPIVLAMKPIEGTFAENALAHGVAGLNIDASRISGGDEYLKSERFNEHKLAGPNSYASAGVSDLKPGFEPSDLGRWPTNLLLDEESAAMFPDAPGQLVDASTNPASRRSQNVYGTLKRGSQEASAERRYTDSGGTNFAAFPGARRMDTGSASRFFYVAKANSSERGAGNNHPTVKPLDLMRYLVKLLAPPSGGLFLEPFMGSGTTLIACKAMGVKAVGIEIEERYCEIAAKRLSQGVLELVP